LEKPLAPRHRAHHGYVAENIPRTYDNDLKIGSLNVNRHVAAQRSWYLHLIVAMSTPYNMYFALHSF
jgi:hypothetical protein